MSETVFIFGAGASRDAGAPTMKDFLGVARQLRKTGGADEIASDSQLVFKGIDALQAVHSKADLDLDNLESVFAAFEMAQMLNKLFGLDEEGISRLPSAMSRVIQHTLESSIKLHVSNGRVMPSGGYYPLVESIRKIRKMDTVSYLTFNYDLCLDYALHFCGCVPQYHLGPFKQQSVSGGVNVFKLHGSLNWCHCQGCGYDVAWELGQYFQRRQWNLMGNVKSVRLAIAAELPQFSHCNGAPGAKEPLLVPPTWNKAGHHAALKSVWSNASQELGNAENIFVIGYSLPDSDQFFHYLYALGSVGGANLRRFWVFDPDPAVEQRFKKILGGLASRRFRFHQVGFAEAVQVIPLNME